VSLSEKIKVTCVVEVEIPRADLWPYDGSVTNAAYTMSISANPDGTLIDFAQYEPKISDVRVSDQIGGDE